MDHRARSHTESSAAVLHIRTNGLLAPRCDRHRLRLSSHSPSRSTPYNTLTAPKQRTIRRLASTLMPLLDAPRCRAAARSLMDVEALQPTRIIDCQGPSSRSQPRSLASSHSKLEFETSHLIAASILEWVELLSR